MLTQTPLIRKYQESDHEYLRQITLNNFHLGSLSVDTNIPAQIQGEYFYKTICEKSFFANSPNCLIASIDNKPVGYIIHGINPTINEIIKLKTGGIILFAVDKKYQNRGIGTKLLIASLGFFNKLDIKLVTVGTDANNLSALHLYQKFGFQKVSSWETLRWYEPINDLCHVLPDITIELFDDEKGCQQLLLQSKQENSLLREKNIKKEAKQKLQKTISQKLIEQVRKNQSYGLVAKNSDRQTVGIMIYERDKTIENIISDKNDKKIFCIKAIATTSSENSKDIIFALLAKLSAQKNEINFIEAYCGFDKTIYKESLREQGFSSKHTTTTLHLNL